MTKETKRFVIGYALYAAVVAALAYLLSGCAEAPAKSAGPMSECRALCRGDVQQFIDDTTQCICRERTQSEGRLLK